MQSPSAGGKKNAMQADHKNSHHADGAASGISKHLLSVKGDDPKSPAGDQLKRRRSTFKGIASSMLSVRRNTKGSIEKDMAAVAAAAAKPKVRLENTYRTCPDDKQQFSSCKAEILIREVLQSQLAGQTYSAVKAPALVAALSERVKAAVKGLHCERYKLVANVLVGPVSEQGLVVASRCLWDCATDTSSTVSYSSANIFAIATVFAVYFE